MRFEFCRSVANSSYSVSAVINEAVINNSKLTIQKQNTRLNLNLN